MHLEFSGAPLIRASSTRVWERLLDPAFLARSVPGVESVEALDPTHFRVVSSLGLGPFKARFSMEVRLYDIVPAQSARMAIQGKAPGSIIEVRSSMRVDDTADGKVQLRWFASADVTGSITGVGRRFLRIIANRLTTHFWADFGRRVGERLPSDRQVQILPM